MTQATIPSPEIRLGAARLFADPSGAIWWPDAATLIVADLHLEKGTSFARDGLLLPPYDTRATLTRLAALIRRLRPDRVVALGDSFHDAEAADRLDPTDQAALTDLVSRQDWLWIAGNHDPRPGPALGGRVELEACVIEGLLLRHEAAAVTDRAELSGHYHPKASIAVHGRRLTCRCFVADARRTILPAFGTYAGGLDVRDPALRRLFPDEFTAHLIGTNRAISISSKHLVRPLSAEDARLL
ncbi:MAG TPA: ligase-associated DNA damage response endonuclease PdeM [Aliidongia sp.]|nr:ligase-associated DNA damage response endonuclease PdeM [Aliidongia sp.]